MKRLIIPSLALAASACTFVRRTPGDIRQAIWVMRFDYQTEQDVRNIIRNCARAGFDTVLFQVRGNGTVFYRSRLEPWAEQFRFRYPGFDPLGVACHEARETGVSLHAWVNACPGWRGDKAPSLESQLFHAKPSWFLFDQNRKRQALIKDFYVWLNPCLPEVRDYVASICEEIALRYPVQGIHLDYIRMPHGKVETGGQDYPRDLRTLELYEAESGKTPDMDPAAWADWKTRQVTAMVAGIRKRLHDAKPRLILSAAVMRTPERARTTVNQDWVSWLDQGLVDLVFPMQYDDDDERFSSQVTSCVEASSSGRVVMGIGVFKHKRPFQTLRQMDLATELGCQGYSLFSYKEFFDEKGKPTAKGKRILNTVRARALDESLQ